MVAAPESGKTAIAKARAFFDDSPPMSVLWLKRTAALLFFLVCAASVRADLSISGVVSPSSINVNETATYTITLANTNLITIINPTLVSQFPSSARIISVTNVPSSVFTTSVITTNAGQVVFSLSQLQPGTSSQITMTLQPTVRGSFTNTFTASATGYVPVVNQLVVSVATLNSDLGLAVSAFPSTAIANDYVTYTSVVTNSGPGAASGVAVTTKLPTNVTVIAVSPTGHHSVSNRFLTLNVGTLTNGQASQFQVTAQLAPGTNTFTHTVSSIDTTDSNAGNNSITSAVNVAPFVPADIQIVSLSNRPEWDPARALFDEVITIKNVSTGALGNIHLIATDLTSTNKIWVLGGTNAGHPFFLATNILNAGESADITVEMFFAKRQPVDVTFIAAGIPTATVVTNSTATNIVNFTNIFNLSTNGTLAFNVQGPTNASFSVLYATNVVDLIPPATNAVRTAPIIATNGLVTITPPLPPPPTGVSNDVTTTRFYRVIQNP
jgi:uncharacterized repeat protein (TIGR01451 family)